MFLKLGWKHDNNNTNNADDEYLISAPLFSDLKALHSKHKYRVKTISTSVYSLFLPLTIMKH